MPHRRAGILERDVCRARSIRSAGPPESGLPAMLGVHPHVPPPVHPTGQDDAASVLDAKGPVERMRAFERSSSQSDSGADHSEPPFRMRQRKSVPCLTVDDGQGGGATFSRLSVESQSKGHNFDAKMQQQQHQATLNSRSIAAASSICMADLIRQVEVHCGERGRALAYTWNAYLVSEQATCIAHVAQMFYLAARCFCWQEHTLGCDRMSKVLAAEHG